MVGGFIMNELVSIIQHGSWYQVAFNCTNENGGTYLSTVTIQGLKKLRKAYKQFNIKHTPGYPCLLSEAIPLELLQSLGL